MAGKKAVSVLLSLILATGLLAACANNNSSVSNPSSQPTNAATNEPSKAPEDEQGSKITEDPLELSIHMHYGNRFAFDDNWSIFKEAAELTNITLKGVTPSTSTNSEEMGNLMLASGQLPDIIHLYFAAADKWGPEGVLIDLKDLIDEHAPNIKKVLDEDPRLRKLATSADGNMYYIPSPNRSTVAKTWLIRQDWLDEAGLPVPNTYQDFYNVLKAFKEKDPKRFPYMGRSVEELRALFNFWGISSTSYMDENGKVLYAPAQPNYKTAVQNISQWYKEGLIDKEIFTRGPQSREILFGDNLSGVTHDFPQSTTGFNDSLKDKIPGFKMIVIPPPQDINGNRVEWSAGSFYKSHGWGISSQSKNPVEAIKYFDFWFSEEGKMLSTYGVEGETYTIENGEVQLTDSVKEGNILENLYKIGAQLEFPHESDLAFNRFTSSEEAVKGMNMYLENNYVKEPFPPISLNEEQKSRYDELTAAVNTYATEQFQKWIMGAQMLNDAAWENYLGELDRLGVKEMIELIQISYDNATSN